MDALQFLADEHDDIRALLFKLQKAEFVDARKVFDETRALLELHQELEETYLYPRLENEEVARELTFEGLEHHHLIDVVMDDMSELKPDDPAWHPRAKVLFENVDNHMSEEEADLFPKVRVLWDADKSGHIAKL